MAASGRTRPRRRPRRSPILLKHLLQRMEHLHPHAKSLGEGLRPDGDNHELLGIHVVRRVGAPVQNVHHRNRQHPCHRAAEVAVQRQPAVLGGGPGDRERHAENGVGAELALLGVPSASIISASTSIWSAAALPSSRGPSTSLTLRTALSRPSRHSASHLRRAARPPRARRWRRRWAPPRALGRHSTASTSVSTVGLPRLSRISRAWTSMMVDIFIRARG